MLRIRLQRAGRKNRPFYRIVLAEHSAPIKGKFRELLGHFNPFSKVVELKKDRVEYWLSVGAAPTETVASVLTKNGISAAAKFVKKQVIKPSKAELEKQKQEEEALQKKAEEEAAAAEAAAAAPAESEETASEKSVAQDAPAEEKTE